MNNLNLTIHEGNLTRDPESKSIAAGTTVCTFTIACNRSYKKDDAYEKETYYFDIETWGKLAELCAAHLHKGRWVRVMGRLKQVQWQQDGKNRSRIYIVGESVEWKPEHKADKEPEMSTEDNFAEGIAEGIKEEIENF